MFHPATVVFGSSVLGQVGLTERTAQRFFLTGLTPNCATVTLFLGHFPAVLAVRCSDASRRPNQLQRPSGCRTVGGWKELGASTLL